MVTRARSMAADEGAQRGVSARRRSGCSVHRAAHSRRAAVGRFSGRHDASRRFRPRTSRWFRQIVTPCSRGGRRCTSRPAVCEWNPHAYSVGYRKPVGRFGFGSRYNSITRSAGVQSAEEPEQFNNFEFRSAEQVQVHFRILHDQNERPMPTRRQVIEAG